MVYRKLVWLSESEKTENGQNIYIYIPSLSYWNIGKEKVDENKCICCYVVE